MLLYWQQAGSQPFFILCQLLCGLVPNEKVSQHCMPCVVLTVQTIPSGTNQNTARQTSQASICPSIPSSVHCGCLQAQEMQEINHRHVSDLETLNKMLRRELEAVRKQVGPSPKPHDFRA